MTKTLCCNRNDNIVSNKDKDNDRVRIIGTYIARLKEGMKTTIASTMLARKGIEKKSKVYACLTCLLFWNEKEV